MSDAPAQSDPPKEPKRRKRRWLLRIVIGFVTLLLVLALVVQILLWTDLPRGIAVSRIERELGLRVTAGSLSTGWLGRTQLEDVTLALPLADKAFLDVKTMKVRHTSLFGLMFGRAISVQDIELDQPHLTVYQGAYGRWNIQEVVELLQRTGGKQAGTESAASTAVPQLPSVRILGGVISVIDNHNRQATIEPLDLNGYADTPVSWKYDVSIRPRVSLTGRLVPGLDWRHEITGKLQDLGAWAKPWEENFPATDIDFTWRGKLDGAINGRLDLQKFAVGRTNSSGSIAIANVGGSWSVRPVNLVVNTGERALPQFTVASGLLQYDGGGKPLRAEQLIFVLFGGPATVNATYDLSAGSGTLAIAWHELVLRSDKIKHSGSLDVTLAHPFPNSPFASTIRMEAALTTTGTTPDGPWHGQANFHAAGPGWTNFDWSVEAPTIEWLRRSRVIGLNGLKIVGNIRPPNVTASGVLNPLLLSVNSISLPGDNRLAGDGSYLFDLNKDALEPWKFYVTGEHWPFHPIEGTELAFAIDLHGDNKVVHLNNFILKSPDAQFSANGSYTYGIPKPLRVEVAVTNAPPYQPPAAVAAAPERQLLHGDIQGHASLIGTINPLLLEVKGDLTGRELDITKYHLGNIDIRIAEKSRIDDNGVEIRTDTLTLLGGRWDVDAVYTFDSDTLGLSVRVGGLSLQQVAGVVGRQDIAGTMDGAINLFVPNVKFDVNHLVVPPSTLKFHKLAIEGHEAMDEAEATLALQNGRLAIDPIKLHRGNGRGELRFLMDLNNPRHMETSATVAAWPFDLPGGGAHADAWADVPQLMIDLPDRKSPDPANHGLRLKARQIDLRASAALKQGRLADMTAHAGVDGRVLDVRSIHADLLGGRIDGFARADFDELTKATAEVTWENLDFAKIAVLFPGLKDLGGQMNGHARLAPATVPHPREPLALLVSSTVKNGHWRTAPIGDMRFAAYLGPNRDDPGGSWRLVMDDTPTDPSFVHLAGGTMHIWGRFGRHASGSFSSQAQLAFSDLDLNVILKAIDPTARQAEGRVNGQLMLLRTNPPKAPPVPLVAEKMFPAPPVVPVPPATGPSPNEPPLQQFIEPLYGEGRVTLSRANLANLPVLAFLYNLMHVFQNVNVPEGKGDLQIHLERGTLTINNMHYFNRGTEVRAVAVIKEIWKIPDSPISGTAAGSARPLRNVKLPGLADFDTILATLQRDLTGVRFSGTLRHPITTGPIGITDFGAELNRMLVGDVSSEVQGGAGG
ncbi:MAG: hypothetical protein JWN24_3698 [Phycisphaerales bacterium]|nr:hypothetical protein [Phycisphaerales bacterium]